MFLEPQRKATIPIWRRDGAERIGTLGKGWVDSHAQVIVTDSPGIAVPALFAGFAGLQGRFTVVPSRSSPWCQVAGTYPIPFAHVPRVKWVEL